LRQWPGGWAIILIRAKVGRAFRAWVIIWRKT
jgi:hypothetical protein